MTDAPQFPAGWYADPDNPSVHRWWNGVAWTEARQPAAPAIPAPAAAQASAAPVAPGPAAAPAYGVYPSAPAYPAYPSAPAATAPVRRDIPTGTPWIWLIVFLPLVSFLPMLFIDWRSYLEDSMTTALESPETAWMSSFTGVSLLMTVGGLVLVAAQVVFAYLDWRALRARGIENPFHWAWIFFILVISNGVYVIGRGIILRRQTGKGLGPVWAWIAVTAVTLMVGATYTFYVFSEMLSLLTDSGLLQRS